MFSAAYDIVCRRPTIFTTVSKSVSTSLVSLKLRVTQLIDAIREFVFIPMMPSVIIRN